MSGKQKVVYVKLEELKDVFFVRQQLNEEHVKLLTGLIESGQVLEPLLITRNNEIVDGRHRRRSYADAGYVEAPCEYTEETDRNILLAMALKSNMGGSLPPQPGDIEKTIRIMLESGVGRNKLYELMAFIPKQLMRKYMDNVQSDIAKNKIRLAMAAMANDDLNIPQAAEKFGVDPESLRRKVSSARRKGKQGVNQINGAIGVSFRGLQQVLNANIKEVLGMVESGEMEPSHADEVFNHIASLVKKQTGRVAEWRRRLEALNETHVAAAEHRE